MIKKVLLYLNILLALIIVFVHLTAIINPLDFSLFAFLGLIYPILLVLIVLFFIYWLFSKSKRAALVSFFALLITWQSNKATFAVNASSANVKEVSLMSWNVKNFDLYNWSGNTETRQKMFDLIEENNPDILCLQEFYTEDKGEFKNLKDLKKRLDYKHVYFAKTFSKENKNHWGLVVFSKYKIIDTGKLTFKEGTLLNSCMYVDVELDENQKARIYNLHLQSNQFSQEDYEYLKHIGEANQLDKQSAGKIVAKLQKGYVNRAKQTQQVMESKADSPYPVIICGDFNDTPVSYAYKTLSEDMKDAFIESGIGFGKTFDNPSPFLRIDYALFHPLFKINDYTRIKEPLSDHFPILVKFTY